MKEKYDYIICGAGLSGLILASRIFEDRFFDDKNILLIDKDLKSSVNKTWCFWETGKRNWYSEDMFTRFIIKKNIETSLN